MRRGSPNDPPSRARRAGRGGAPCELDSSCAEAARKASDARPGSIDKIGRESLRYERCGINVPTLQFGRLRPPERAKTHIRLCHRSNPDSIATALGKTVSRDSASTVGKEPVAICARGGLFDLRAKDRAELVPRLDTGAARLGLTQGAGASHGRADAKPALNFSARDSLDTSPSGPSRFAGEAGIADTTEETSKLLPNHAHDVDVATKFVVDGAAQRPKIVMDVGLDGFRIDLEVRYRLTANSKRHPGVRQTAHQRDVGIIYTLIAGAEGGVVEDDRGGEPADNDNQFAMIGGHAVFGKCVEVARHGDKPRIRLVDLGRGVHDIKDNFIGKIRVGCLLRAWDFLGRAVTRNGKVLRRLSQRRYGKCDQTDQCQSKASVGPFRRSLRKQGISVLIWVSHFQHTSRRT